MNKIMTMRMHKIYLDYHSTTPTDSRVIEVMKPFFSEEFGNPHSGNHAFGWTANKAVEKAREQVAQLINADPDEIIFTSGATESNNLAIIGSALAIRENEKKRIIVSSIEHKCVLNAATYLKEQGFEVLILPVDKSGIVSISTLEDMIDNTTALVSIMAVNNEIGTIQPIKKIGELCRKHGVLFHTDAAQAPLFMPIDRTDTHIDLLSLSSHKLYGPKGIGALYINRNIKLKPKPLIYGGGQEQGLRSGTLPSMLCVGFGEACNIAKSEQGEYALKAKELSGELFKALEKGIPGIVLNGSRKDRHPGNVNILFPNVDADSLLGALQPIIAASTGSACTTGIPEPSHVLTAIGLNTEQAERSIRFCVGRQTTKDDIRFAESFIINKYHELIKHMLSEAV